MNFELTDEQKLVQETAREFAVNDIAPTLVEEERNHEFRLDRVQRMGELGFFSCGVPEALGGTGFGFLESVLMAEQVARVSASWRLPFNMQNLGPALTVAKFGTPEQQERFVPGWVAGTQIGFFGMTEPESGSDVASMTTVARDRGDHWELTGQQDLGVERHPGGRGAALRHDRSGAEAPGHERVHPGAQEGRRLRRDRHRHEARPALRAHRGDGVPRHEAAEGRAARRARRRVQGSAMWQLNNTRLGCAAGALGVAGAALDAAVSYANERTQFGKPISHHQMVQAQIAEMALEHESARMLVYRAAWLKDNGRPNQYETSLAKLQASEAAVHAANECMKIYGSYGYSTEYPAERLYRDAKSLQVVEGTSNVQKLIISGIACGHTPNR